MRELITQQQFRTLQSLPFCYLCSESLDGVANAERNLDHVVPKNLFLEQDRTPPLTLPSHWKCNNDESHSDEIAAQLVHLLHRQKSTLIDCEIVEPDPFFPKVGVRVDLKGIIWRWVRGFHEALYREPLGSTSWKLIHPPMPYAEPEGPRVVLKDRLHENARIVENLKKNRAAGRIDRVVCCNEKCVYECVWVRSDGGQWACFFGLEIYDWKKLGDSANFPERGCVGAYLRDGAPPPDAALETAVEIPVPNLVPLDPFGA